MSSEALLCLGVATIVASFVVDVNADGSKPNIWILIGGVIMQKCVKNLLKGIEGNDFQRFGEFFASLK